MPDDQHNAQSPLHPQSVVLITPSDSTDLARTIYGFSFAGAGALRVTTASGQTVTIPSGALAAGVQHSLKIVRVWATGTGATGIVGYY